MQMIMLLYVVLFFLFPLCVSQRCYTYKDASDLDHPVVGSTEGCTLCGLNIFYNIPDGSVSHVQSVCLTGVAECPAGIDVNDPNKLCINGTKIEFGEEMYAMACCCTGHLCNGPGFWRATTTTAATTTSITTTESSKGVKCIGAGGGELLCENGFCMVIYYKNGTWRQECATDLCLEEINNKCWYDEHQTVCCCATHKCNHDDFYSKASPEAEYRSFYFKLKYPNNANVIAVNSVYFIVSFVLRDLLYKNWSS